MAGNVSDVTDAAFEQEVLQADKPVLVDFWAPWCGPCKHLTPVVEAVADKLQGRLKVVKLNVDDNIETATAYRVQSIPMLIWFKDGQKVDQAIGYMDESALTSKCEAALR